MRRRERGRLARLAALEARLRQHDPTVRVALTRRRIDAATARLARLVLEVTARPQRQLERARLRLHALSPLAVLNRGYAIIYLEQGADAADTILRSGAQAQPNQTIRARLAQGIVRAIITETRSE